MKGTRAELKAAILAQLEAELDQVLDWTDEHQAPTMAEIEQVVLRHRQEMGRAMVTAVVEAQDKRQDVPGPVCSVCGREMRLKGQKRRQMLTLMGDVTVERAYYYCPRCRRGFFPPR